jgi:DHA1 family inner membrane transport protein
MIAVASLRWLVPKQAAGKGSLLREFRILRKPQVLLVLAMSALCSASLFCVFTYITPTLETVTGISPHGVTIVLLVFGVGITAGNMAGGRLGDWRQMPAIIGTLLVLLAVLVILNQTERFVVPAVLAILLWGFVQFSVGIPLQTRIVDQAHAAPNLASTLNQGAFNLGNALGASLGGLMLTSGFGYRELPWGSAAVTAGAIVLALWSAKLDRLEAAFRPEAAGAST